jgi:putative transposase
VAAEFGVPRSTAVSWIRRGPHPVVTAELFTRDEQQLRAEVLKLQRRVQVLLCIVRLLLVVIRLSGFRLDSLRVPTSEAKAAILSAVARAKQAVPLTVALRVLGLSPARYHAWRRLEQVCSLEDRTSCPRTVPTQLTAQEIATIHEMVTSEDYRHMPIGALALFAQRIRKVLAAPATWARLIRERGWLRPRRRLYPEKPKTGIRAGKPNEIWHIDVTVIRLLDGTKTYLHAVIDHFSRRILACKLATRLEPESTCWVLSQAAQHLPANAEPTTVMADSGVENINGEVDQLFGLGPLRRVLAQVEVVFSNSMIEAFWRSLKNNWLYLNQLDSSARLEKLVGFYLEQHNAAVPHAAFRGQTPDEMYFGRGETVAQELAVARKAARTARIEQNRGLECKDCRTASAAVVPRQPVAPQEREAA